MREYGIRVYLMDGTALHLTVRAKCAGVAVKRGMRAARVMGYRVESGIWTTVQPC